MFFCFLYFSCSFQGEESFWKNVNQSFNAPVVVYFGHGNIQLSRIGLIKYKSIQEKYEKSVLFYDMDCVEDYFFCKFFRVSDFPSILLIRGYDRFYHRRYSGNFSAKSIESFLDNYVTPPVRVINDISDFLTHVDQQIDTSIPLFQCNSDFSDLAIELSSISMATGRQLFVKGSQELSFDMYLSSDCMIRYDGNTTKQPMLNFIYENRFSIIHKFTYEEIQTYRTDLPMLLLVSTRGFKEEHHILLSEIAKKLCGNYVFGWVNPFEDRRLNITFQQQPEDPSNVAYVDRKKKQVFKLLKPPTITNVQRFVLNVTTFNQRSKEWDNGIPVFVAVILVILISYVVLYFNNIYQGVLLKLIEFGFESK